VQPGKTRFKPVPSAGRTLDTPDYQGILIIGINRKYSESRRMQRFYFISSQPSTVNGQHDMANFAIALKNHHFQRSP
jgi:hypothetical protein